jgi:predicted metalloendopeptidase
VLEPLPGTLLMVIYLRSIGDLGGVNAAYDGLQLYLKKMETGLIDGYTPEQRSLLGQRFGVLNLATKR